MLLSEKLGQLKKHIQGARRVVSRGGVSKAGSPCVKVPIHPAGMFLGLLAQTGSRHFFVYPCILVPETQDKSNMGDWE